MMVMELSRAIFSQAFNWLPGRAAPATAPGTASSGVRAAAAELDLAAGPGSVRAMTKPPPTVAVAFKKSRRLKVDAGVTSLCPLAAVPRPDVWPCGFGDRCRSGIYCR